MASNFDLFGDDFNNIEPQVTATEGVDAGEQFLQNTENDIQQLESQFLSTDISDPFATENKIDTNDMSGFEMVNGDGGGGDSDIDIMGNDENTIEASQHEGLNLDFSNGISGIPDSLDNSLQQHTSSSPVIMSAGPTYDINVEPESIRTWRREFTIKIEEADAKEEAARKEMLAEAKKSLDDWQRQREEALELTKQANRADEKVFIEERASREEEGKSRGEVLNMDWSKTADLCDFNSKSSKGRKDTPRMRGILLHLKKDAKEDTVEDGFA